MKRFVAIQKLSVFLLLMFTITSCKVMLVPEYSAQLEDQITNTAKATDKLYVDMLDTPASERTFRLFNEQYNNIQVEINSIQLKNEGRPKNGDFLVIIKNLKGAFAEAKKYHKDHKILSDGEAIAYESTLAAFWKPLYIAEKALK